MLDKFIIQNCEFVFLLLVSEILGFILIIPEKNPDFSFAGIKQLKCKINYAFLFFKSKSVDFLPFYFLVNPCLNQ